MLSLKISTLSYATGCYIGSQQSKCQSGTGTRRQFPHQMSKGKCIQLHTVGVWVLSFSQMITSISIIINFTNFRDFLMFSKSVTILPCGMVLGWTTGTRPSLYRMCLPQYTIVFWNCLCLASFRLLGLPDFARSLWGHWCSTLWEAIHQTQFFSATHLALSRDAKHNVCTVYLYQSWYCTADRSFRLSYTHQMSAPLLLHHRNTPVL